MKPTEGGREGKGSRGLHPGQKTLVGTEERREKVEVGERSRLV